MRRRASGWVPHGVPALYMIAGNSAQSVTERLQRLVGTTPLPPVWALGHHQSRWGYAGMQQLSQLDQAFTDHAFPNDGLWLDIDYMQDYKVFTTNPAHFENLTEDLRGLQAQGGASCPFWTPASKCSPVLPWPRGQAADIFCRNPKASRMSVLSGQDAPGFPIFRCPRHATGGPAMRRPFAPAALMEPGWT